MSPLGPSALAISHSTRRRRSSLPVATRVSDAFRRPVSDRMQSACRPASDGSGGRHRAAELDDAKTAWHEPRQAGVDLPREGELHCHLRVAQRLNVDQVRGGRLGGVRSRSLVGLS